MRNVAAMRTTQDEGGGLLKYRKNCVATLRNTLVVSDFDVDIVAVVLCGSVEPRRNGKESKQLGSSGG